MGYAYKIKFKLTPVAGGSDLLYDQALITSTYGPISTVVEYQPETIQRMTPTRRIVEYALGWRCVVTMKYEFTVTNDETYLITPISQILGSTYRVYLSLDNGGTYRQVVLDGPVTREPLGGATFAGVKESVTLKCVDLLGSLPPVYAGGW